MSNLSYYIDQYRRSPLLGKMAAYGAIMQTVKLERNRPLPDKWGPKAHTRHVFFILSPEDKCEVIRALELKRPGLYRHEIAKAVNWSIIDMDKFMELNTGNIQ